MGVTSRPVKSKDIKLQLEQIANFDARRGGLRRLERSGFGIYFGHLHACADVWVTPHEQILVRFSHACYKHYFRVVLPRGVMASQLDFGDLEDYLHPELYDWFEGALDDFGDSF